MQMFFIEAYCIGGEIVHSKMETREDNQNYKEQHYIIHKPK